MEFEARMIDEADFHGIRRLLQQVTSDSCTTGLESGSPSRIQLSSLLT